MQIELSPDVGAKREIYDEQKTNRAAKEENQTDVREKWSWHYHEIIINDRGIFWSQSRFI